MRLVSSTKMKSVTVDPRGNVAIVFAAAIFVLAGICGVALDVGRAGTAKAELQSALDSAILAAARRKSNNEENAISAVENFIRANFEERYPGLNVAVQANITNEGKVVATANAKLRTTLLQVLGYREITVQAHSAAQYGAGVADVVLVLDNTASMSGSKIEALKDGAKNLVDIIYEPADSDQTVRMGVVPFSQYVNVGLNYRNANWLDVEPDSSVTNTECWDTYPNAVASNCREVTYTAYNDGNPYTATTTVCDWDYGSPVQQCGLVTREKIWRGCVGSRNHPADTNLFNNQWNTNPVPGVMYETYVRDPICPRPLVRLTNDKNAIKAELDQMIPVGDTYIQSGLIWGWRVLSPTPPFGDGFSRQDRPDLKRFLVLMTDGKNSIAPTYPYHEMDQSADSTIADGLTLETCNSIKAEGTFIYAIAFDVADQTTRDMLRNCATAPPYYYQAEDDDALRSAFETIASAVVAIRLTR